MLVTAANWKYNSILRSKTEIPEFRYRQSAFFGLQSREWTSLVAQETFFCWLTKNTAAAGGERRNLEQMAETPQQFKLIQPKLTAQVSI